MRFLLALILGAHVIAIGHAATSAATNIGSSSQRTMPLNEFGRPDFQGYWFFGSRTPLQRPSNLGEKQTYTIEEARELEQRMQERLDRQDAPLDPNRGAPEKGARIGQEADDAFLGHYVEAKLYPICLLYTSPSPRYS